MIGRPEQRPLNTTSLPVSQDTCGDASRIIGLKSSQGLSNDCALGQGSGTKVRKGPAHRLDHKGCDSLVVWDAGHVPDRPDITTVGHIVETGSTSTGGGLHWQPPCLRAPEKQELTQA